jgi:hypothetical protein
VAEAINRSGSDEAERSPHISVATRGGEDVSTPKRLGFRSRAAIVAWIICLFLVDVPVPCPCWVRFEGWSGFPVPYYWWTDDGPPFDWFYPWAIPVDIAFAVGSTVLIAFLLRRQAG